MRHGKHVHAVVVRPLVVAMLAVLTASSASAHKGLFIVRHAEKASSTDPDTALSMQGEDRASALARLLRNAHVTDVFTTEFKRTQQTVEPLTLQRGLEAKTIAAKDTAVLVTALKALKPDAVAVVAGHSDTIPEILKGLGIKDKITIREDQYNRIFFLTPDNQLIELGF
ncbi:MAG TPA: histidine phosphatase family protein [Myxococcota bacterium]